MSLIAFFSPEKVNSPKARMLSRRSRCLIASVPIDRITLDEAATRIIAALQQRSAQKPLLVMGPNAQLVTLAQRNPTFLKALNTASLNIPDGISVVLASKLLGRPTPARVTGGDLMERLCLESARHNLRVFFLGGLPDAAHQAALRLQERYPGFSVAGAYCPPDGFDHDPVEQAYIRKLVSEAAPDLLFVAFGAPKQEIWMLDSCPTLPIGAALSVGAAFDTQAGMRKRAPRWTHSLGVEWLYRLIREPRRLWRRYLFGNTHFLYLVLKQYLIYGRFFDDKKMPQVADVISPPIPFSMRSHSAPLGTAKAESKA
jgi:N-acetylglucosaminyldiphosphoundecaprenol N-acetyl-beta-D-mannosaminyltransferase